MSADLKVSLGVFAGSLVVFLVCLGTAASDGTRVLVGASALACVLVWARDNAGVRS